MPHRIKDVLPQLDAAGMEFAIAEMILFAGMTTLKRLTLPPMIEGVSWAECWARGLERISALGGEALDRERESV